MNLDLQNLLPRLLPVAISWAEGVAAEVAATGVALDASDLSVASTVGVQQPSDIRVQMVDQMPLPSDPLLQAAALQAGLLGPTMMGLTLGYSILISKGHMSRRLLSHECRHVFQYEQAGSISAFFPLYLGSVIQAGYENSPYEVDARAYEFSAP